MKTIKEDIDKYISSIPEDKKEMIMLLRSTIKENLPQGYSETIGSGMINYAVPHSLYPSGYHCNPQDPLPFISLAAQKNNVSLYHMGLYADAKLLNWFTGEYPKYSKRKLDMGKSCIRFKKPDDIPVKLLGELFTKLSPDAWISIYERVFKK